MKIPDSKIVIIAGVSEISQLPVQEAVPQTTIVSQQALMFKSSFVMFCRQQLEQSGPEDKTSHRVRRLIKNFQKTASCKERKFENNAKFYFL